MAAVLEEQGEMTKCVANKGSLSCEDLEHPAAVIN
jgi:hypothetical protein